MSNFSQKLQDASEKELLHMVNELDFRVVPLASDELTRRTIKQLQNTIEESNKHSAVLEKANYRLQVIMLILTAIGTFIAISPAIKIILQWLANALNSSLASTDLLTIISTAISAIVTGLTYYGFSKETTLQMKQKNLTK